MSSRKTWPMNRPPYHWKLSTFLDFKTWQSRTLSSYKMILKDTSIPMLITTLFTTAKTWKQLKCPLTEDSIKKMWYTCIYTQEGIFSSVQLLSSVRLFATPWIAARQTSLVHHQLLEFTQTHIHPVSDAIQPSHPLSSPSPAPNPSQHQSLFQWVNSSHEVAKVLEFQL